MSGPLDLLPKKGDGEHTPAPKRELTNLELKIINFVDQRFWETGGIVSYEVIAETLQVPKATVTKAMTDSRVRETLLARGVDLEESGEGLLTSQQLVLANMLLNLDDKQSRRQKLELLNIKPQTYYSWLRQPAFQNYLRKRAQALFGAADYTAYTSLIDAVEGGDMSAIKLFFEMRGIYTPKQQIDVNVEVLITSVIEVIAKRVDPETLKLIAEDLEKIQGIGAGAAEQIIDIPALPGRV